MVHGEARAECCYFKFLDSVPCLALFLYYLPYLIGKILLYLWVYFSLILLHKFYILSVSLSVEMAVVVVPVFFGVAVPLYVPVSLSNVIFTL